MRLAQVVNRNGQQRPAQGQVFGGRVVRVEFEVVDNFRHSGIDQPPQQPAGQQRQAVLLLPGVDLLGPRRAAGDAVVRIRQSAAAERQPLVAGHKLPDLLPVGADHFLGIAVAAQLLHGIDDQVEPLPPVGHRGFREDGLFGD